MIGAILKALAELLHWQRVEAEIRARRLLYDERRKIDDEIDELTEQLARARAAGVPELADDLLRRQAAGVLYRAGLPEAPARGDLHGDPPAGNVGK